MSAHANPTNCFPELPPITTPEEIHDTCRESQLTPGEAHAAYLELNGQITVHLDTYVEERAKATNSFKDLLTPLLAQMQELLSKRGRLRKLLDIARVQTWEDWLDEFEERLHLHIHIRTIQRWLKEYREAEMEQPPSPDVNVIAKQAVRYVESRKQAEKLDAAVEAKHELNPAIRAEMIRAYRAKGHHYLAVADELEKGFTPLPVAETGKAHQHYVSEQRAKLPDPLLEEKLNLASDFSNATVREITYDEAKNMIYANEYLGTMPGGVVGCYGLFFGEYLGAVEVFGSTAGTKVNTQAPGHCVKPKVGFFADFTTVRNRNPGIPSSVEDNLFDFFLTSHVLSRSLRASVRQSPS